MNLTLNISSKEVRLLAMNKGVVQHWSRKELPSGWIKDGYITEPRGVGAIIVSLLESARASKDRFAVCISGLPFTYRMTTFPRMKQGIMKESVRHFMRKEISMPVEQMSISWAVMDESREEVKLLILGVDQKIVDAVAETMREARIRYWTLDLKSLALARVASPDNAIMVSAEPDCYDIVIIADGSISTMHTVTVEEEDRGDAEHSKRILIETSKAITYDAKKRGCLPEKKIPLLLTGELSSDKDFRDAIQAELGHKVKPLAPSLALPAGFPAHLYSANIGLALRASGDNPEPGPQQAGVYNDINLDILFGRYAAHPRRISSLYLILPMALSLVISLALPIYWAQSEHARESLRLQNELTIVDRQLQQARLIDEGVRGIESKRQALYSQLQGLKEGYRELFGNQGEFALNLRKVVGALPAQSYFTQISHSPQQITVRGQAEDAFEALDYTKALEQEGLFPEVRIQQIGDAPGDNATDDMVTFEVIISNTYEVSPPGKDE